MSEPPGVSEVDERPAIEPTAAEPPAAVAGQVAASAQETRSHHFWLTRKNQLFLGVLLSAVLALMVVHWVRLSGWGMQPVEIEHQPSRQYEFRLDINRATWVEWVQMDGIGETLGRRIVEDRETNGPFRSIDDIQRVKGIGPITLEKMRPWLRISKDDFPE